MLHLHETYLSLGALAWAATGKDPGLSPLFILNELVRTSRYRPEDLAVVELARPVSVGELKQKLLAAVREAEDLLGRLPAVGVGCLDLAAAGRPVTPDPQAPDFAGLRRHFGSLRGSWPRVVRE